MENYVDFNTEKRKNATNSFQKNFFKLMINSVYHKTMENLPQKMSFKIVNNENDYLKPYWQTNFYFYKNL